MRTRSISHEQLVLKLANRFRSSGYDGVTLNDLAAEAGLNKATLYHFFPDGKEQMALAVLELANEWILREIVGVLQSQASPKSRIEKVAKALTEFYESGTKACLLEIMVASSAGERMQRSIQKSFSDLLRGFETYFLDLNRSPAEARAHAESTVIALQGSLILARAQRDASIFKRQLKMLARTAAGD